MNGRLLRILGKELSRLHREESGVALMLTLSVVLLLYVLCAGVYAVGETVRQKIEMQNACDTAAYSAALVEADGLSRMAMINRAMAWTYVQLTNMQIDYITYKWLELVEKRFAADERMCENWSRESYKYSKISVGKPACSECSALKSKDVGWLCGIAGKGSDYVRLNGSSTPIPISTIQSTLQNASQILQYATYIPEFKKMIVRYNTDLMSVAGKMNSAIGQTAMAVLRENLPRMGDGQMDEDASADFLGYCQSPTFYSPYQSVDVGENIVVGNIVSPLYNTELDERIFLTMADGEVYDNLADYFGPSGDSNKRYGGLDQWFVRSYPDETKIDARQILPSAESDVKNSYKAIGICRTYKNANRIGNEQLPAYRAHHCGFGTSDYKPSCVNTHVNCPDQCLQAPDVVAPYADYEWCACGHYDYSCTRVYIPKVCDIHVHTFSSKFLEGCQVKTHICTTCTPSHSRSQYGNCWVKGKKLRTIEPISGTELTPWPIISPYPGAIDSQWWTSRVTVQLSVVNKPNGFARVYGDDKEICNANTFQYYTGEAAMPWMLNDRYYSGGGSIVVGLARKQRNPWAVLLNGLSAAVKSDVRNADGIYSVFDPVADGYQVVFSAARAAHRFHPSAKAGQWGADVALASEGEYETRYDAVCDDMLDAAGNLGRFNVRQSDADFQKLRIGCVCKDDRNQRRFARCWNLCETDWDATLLPLKYSQFGLSTEWYDSLTGPTEVMWSDDDVLDDDSRNAFVTATKDILDEVSGRAKGNWTAFVSGDAVSGGFLALSAPPRPGSASNVQAPSATRFLDSPSQTTERMDVPSVNNGKLNLDLLIRKRIL